MSKIKQLFEALRESAKDFEGTLEDYGWNEGDRVFFGNEDDPQDDCLSAYVEDGILEIYSQRSGEEITLRFNFNNHMCELHYSDVPDDIDEYIDPYKVPTKEDLKNTWNRLSKLEQDDISLNAEDWLDNLEEFPVVEPYLRKLLDAKSNESVISIIKEIVDRFGSFLLPSSDEDEYEIVYRLGSIDELPDELDGELANSNYDKGAFKAGDYLVWCEHFSDNPNNVVKLDNYIEDNGLSGKDVLTHWISLF